MLATFEMCQKCACLYESGATCANCGTATARKPAAAPTLSIVTPPPVRTLTPPQREAVHALGDISMEMTDDASADTVVDIASPRESPRPSLKPVGRPVIASAPPRTETGSHESHTLAFHGRGGSFLGIHIVNMLLTMVTLGVYYFWGKVKVRNYLYSQSEFHGDRFAYHGTGKELFLGFLRAALAFGCLSLLFKAAPFLPGGTAVKIGVMILAYCALLVLIPFAIASSRRYRMSRSSWRGIRFSFRGSAADFIRLFLKGVGLSALTLGFYYPYFVARQQKFLVSHTYFGNERFGFDGTGRELMKVYLPFMALPALVGLAFAIFIPMGMAMEGSGKMIGLVPFALIPVIALSWFWFLANTQRYLWNHTSFGVHGARFRATMTGGRFCLLKLGNALLLVLTLGLAWPWTMVRNINFTFHHLSLEGALDLAAVQQDAQSATAVGEGVDTLMDLDAGFAG